ncbi:hypothetical protein P4E94_09720 [Pontiellaceae bacterium B12219]|nr:hypothetical protein [Pontiellaceae bacterium B12219]
MHWKGILTISIALCAAPLLCNAKVWRVVGEYHGRINPTGLPWTKAYQTRMSVNGRQSDLVMYTARYTEPVIEQIRRQFEMQGATVNVRSTLEGAIGIAKWEDAVAKFLIISSPQMPTHFMFFTYPDKGMEIKVPKLPVPSYGNGERLSIVEDLDTSTIVATYKTYDTSTEVHSYYATQLKSNGWEMVLPARVHSGSVSGVAIYQKKKKICYVQAVDRGDGPNMITLLVKGGTL